jgi:hypothetical protein
MQTPPIVLPDPPLVGSWTAIVILLGMVVPLAARGVDETELRATPHLFEDAASVRRFRAEAAHDASSLSASAVGVPAAAV